MSAKTKLKHSLLQLLQHDHGGSYNTRHDRKGLLLKFISDVHTLGYKITHIRELKPKHITAVVAHWQQQQLSNATIKNRTSAIRHVAYLINKSEIVPNNKALNIGARHYTAVENRALINPNFQNIPNEHIRVSLELQRVFGLRREESLKIKPYLADKGHCIALQPSWCKGGRGRFVPIQTEEQRYWLEQAKKLAGSGSLIPQGKNYIQHRYVYDKQTVRAGLKNLHGLRHAYAQQRYYEITGWQAPINGGPKSSQLTQEQKELDYQARMILSEVLGHSREQITVNYLGR